mmetsp:Transcript_26202/g.46769  ORF Transcript_26202/g.46769 Transcript_26202/m.46769 type:complete len:233 (+) Transcript_26202:3288-3986(+)
MDQDSPMDLEGDWAQHFVLPQVTGGQIHVNSACLANTMDMCMDYQLSQHYSYTPQIPETLPSVQTEKRKRGRKPLRPDDPIKKKTEEKDKYWLRAFRAYMKTIYPEIEEDLCPKERGFWEEFFTLAGKPSKGRKFLSYGKKYKDYLFARPSFVIFFRKWFVDEGERELSKKCAPGSDLWFVYYDYAQKELLNYSVKQLEHPDELENDTFYTDEYTLRGGPTNEFVELVLKKV